MPENSEEKYKSLVLHTAFLGMSNLKELYLQDNLITSINNVTFTVLKNIQILYLQGLFF